jgi:MFS family permease
MYYTDDVIEQSTEQKLLLHLLPLLCLVAMAGTLNQLSLQYAASALGQALDLDATQLGIAENLFCLGYLAASLPAAWLLLRFGPRLWISGAVLATGCMALAQALVWDAGSLYAVRLLLGVAEAGLPPAMVFYLMQWMPEQHRPKGIVALVAAAALVPLFAGELSQFILWIAGWFGFDNWRCLFVVEGLPTLWLGLHVPGRTPEAPAEVSWLPPSERLWLLDRLGQSAAAGAALRFADGLRNVAAWKLAAVQGIVGLVGGSLGMWVPLAMQQSGYVRPGIGFAIMLIAAAIGMGSAVGAGLVWHERAQWRRVLIVGLAVAGVCLGIAAALPFGIAAVLMLAVVAMIVPGMLALSWVMAPCVLAGVAAASGFALVSMAGTLGYFAAGGLAAVQNDAGGRCIVLAVACFVAAWLVRGLDGRHPAGLTASAVTPGE